MVHTCFWWCLSVSHSFSFASSADLSSSMRMGSFFAAASFGSAFFFGFAPAECYSGARDQVSGAALRTEKSKHRKSHDRKSKIETKDMQSIATNRILVYQCICVCVRVPKLLCIAMSIWNLAKTNSTWTEDVPSSARLALRSISKLSQPHSTWRFLLQSSWCTRASGQTPVFTESTWKSRTNLPELKDVATPQSRLLQIRYWGYPFPLKKSPTLTLSTALFVQWHRPYKTT